MGDEARVMHAREFLQEESLEGCDGGRPLAAGGLLLPAKAHAAGRADPSGSAPSTTLPPAKKATDFRAYRLEIVRVAPDGAGGAVDSAGEKSDRFSRLTA